MVKPQEMHLYRVVYKVYLSPGHPQYWNVQFGRLFVWVFGHSPEDAAERALAIVRQLPYEVVNKDYCMILENMREEMPDLAGFLLTANGAGLALYLAGCPPGADEDDFLSSEF